MDESFATGNKYNHGSAFRIGILLNVIYVIVEAIYGLKINSSALIADAGHNASDVLSLILSWGAICLAKLRPFGKYTYGFRKTTILSTSINGILIIGAAVFILIEAIKKIANPSEIQGDVMMIVAGIGILINTGTALMFLKGKQSDLNIRGTFLHMAADAAVSAGVLAGGLIIIKTGAVWVDPVLSFIIVLVIIWSASGLLIDSFRLTVDAVPDNIDLEIVKKYLQAFDGVKEVHELHIWALSTTETALTAHLVIPEGCDYTYIGNIRKHLHEKFNIEHCTLQVEDAVNQDECQEYRI